MKTILQLSALLLFFFVSADAGAADETYQRALQLFKNRDYKNAVLLLEGYVAQQPDAAAYYILGYSSYELRDFQKAREYFDDAYLLDPGFTDDRIFKHYDPSYEELALIHEVLELSGTRGQLAGYANVVGNGLPYLQEDQRDKRVRRELLRHIRDAYRTETMYPDVVDIFRFRFQKDHLTAVLSWLKTPVGKKMMMLDAGTTSPEGIHKVEAFGRGHIKIEENRKKIFVRMEKALNATEMNIEVLSVSLFEMLAAMQSQFDGKNRMSARQINSFSEKIRTISKEQVTRPIMLLMAYTYREFTDTELEAVIRFYDTPAGKWFADTRRRAITFALGKASMQVGEKIGKSIMTKNIPL
jgi:tetratricopeptide (TPR) repeat protein